VADQDRRPGREAPPYTNAELEAVERQYSLLSRDRVEHYYREKHDEATMIGEKLPTPRTIQELVAIWKLLWRWRRK
jgi:hypothetical protein